MITKHEDTIAEGLADSQAYADWSGAVDELYESLSSHPTGNLDKLDAKNIDHLRAQIAVLEGSADEKSQREKLQLEIANRRFDSLDTIAKLSLLHCLSMFNPTAPPTYSFNVMTMRLGDDPRFKRSEFGIRAKRVDPGSAATLMDVAQELDAQVRYVNGAVKAGAKVWVKDKKRWSELRTLRRPGYRKTFQAETVTEGVIEDKAISFLLEHPYVNKSEVRYFLPNVLADVPVMSQKTKSDRDLGTSYSDSLIDIRVKNRKKVMYVPLVAIMQAKGMETTRYATPFRYDQGASVEVKIGRRLMPTTIMPDDSTLA